MLDYIFLIPAWWLASEFSGYFVHKLMHARFVPEHEDHHMDKYPPTDFYSDEYRVSGTGSNWRQNIWYVLSVLPFATLIYFWLGWQHVLSFALTGVCTALWNQYIHEAKHITNHWLGRFVLTGWYFRWIQNRHFIHHIELHKNLGMYNYVWDTLLLTKRDTVRVPWETASPWAIREKARKELKSKEAAS